MGWDIRCTDKGCGGKTWANNIVDLIKNHNDIRAGRFRCHCGKDGYIEKDFKMQEGGDNWKPYLRGIIPLGKVGDSYQPFVFLISNRPNSKITDIWFSYYKDLRRSGGRLKLGYGPGGPPVLDKGKFLRLLSQLVARRHFTKNEITSAIRKSAS